MWSLIKLTRQVNRQVPSQSLFQPLVYHPNSGSSIHRHKNEVGEYDFEKSDETWLQTEHIAEPEVSSRESVFSTASLSNVLSQLKKRGQIQGRIGLNRIPVKFTLIKIVVFK